MEKLQRRKLPVGNLIINGKNHNIYEGVNIIGRDRSCTVSLINSTISKLHCQIIVVENRHYISDFRSTNETSLFKERLIPFKCYKLHSDSVLIFGDVEAIYKILEHDSAFKTPITVKKKVDYTTHDGLTQEINNDRTSSSSQISSQSSQIYDDTPTQLLCTNIHEMPTQDWVDISVNCDNSLNESKITDTSIQSLNNTEATIKIIQNRNSEIMNSTCSYQKHVGTEDNSVLVPETQAFTDMDQNVHRNESVNIMINDTCDITAFSEQNILIGRELEPCKNIRFNEQEIENNLSEGDIIEESDDSMDFRETLTWNSITNMKKDISKNLNEKKSLACEISNDKVDTPVDMQLIAVNISPKKSNSFKEKTNIICRSETQANVLILKVQDIAHKSCSEDIEVENVNVDLNNTEVASETQDIIQMKKQSKPRRLSYNSENEVLTQDHNSDNRNNVNEDVLNKNKQDHVNYGFDDDNSSPLIRIPKHTKKNKAAIDYSDSDKHTSESLSNNEPNLNMNKNNVGNDSGSETDFDENVDEGLKSDLKFTSGNKTNKVKSQTTANENNNIFKSQDDVAVEDSGSETDFEENIVCKNVSNSKKMEVKVLSNKTESENFEENVGGLKSDLKFTSGNKTNKVKSQTTSNENNSIFKSQDDVVLEDSGSETDFEENIECENVSNSKKMEVKVLSNKTESSLMNLFESEIEKKQEPTRQLKCKENELIDIKTVDILDKNNDIYDMPTQIFDCELGQNDVNTLYDASTQILCDRSQSKRSKVCNFDTSIFEASTQVIESRQISNLDPCASSTLLSNIIKLSDVTSPERSLQSIDKDISAIELRSSEEVCLDTDKSITEICNENTPNEELKENESVDSIFLEKTIVLNVVSKQNVRKENENFQNEISNQKNNKTIIAKSKETLSNSINLQKNIKKEEKKSDVKTVVSVCKKIEIMKENIESKYDCERNIEMLPTNSDIDDVFEMQTQVFNSNMPKEKIMNAADENILTDVDEMDDFEDFYTSKKNRYREMREKSTNDNSDIKALTATLVQIDKEVIKSLEDMKSKIEKMESNKTKIEFKSKKHLNKIQNVDKDESTDNLIKNKTSSVNLSEIELNNEDAEKNITTNIKMQKKRKNEHPTDQCSNIREKRSTRNKLVSTDLYKKSDTINNSRTKSQNKLMKDNQTEVASTSKSIEQMDCSGTGNQEIIMNVDSSKRTRKRTLPKRFQNDDISVNMGHGDSVSKTYNKRSKNDKTIVPSFSEKSNSFTNLDKTPQDDIGCKSSENIIKDITKISQLSVETAINQLKELSKKTVCKAKGTSEKKERENKTNTQSSVDVALEKSEDIPKRKLRRTAGVTKSEKTENDSCTSSSSVSIKLEDIGSRRKRTTIASSSVQNKLKSDCETDTDISKPVLRNKSRKRATTSALKNESPQKISCKELNTASQRRSQREKYNILFTKYQSTAQEIIAKRLGGKIVDSVATGNVLVTDEVRRTTKLLSFIARGKPIVSPGWLKACDTANEFLNPWDYLLTDKKAEHNFQFNLKDSLNKASEGLLLDGWTIIVTQSVLNADIKGMIENSGGKCIARCPTVLPEKCFVISHEDDRSKWSSILKKKPTPVIVSAEAIFSGLLRQELEFEPYKLN